MGFLLSLFTNKYVLIGIIVTAIVGGGTFYISNLKGDVTKLTADNTVLKSDLSVSEASVKTLQASITDQNTAIDAFKADADARAKSHIVELTAAKKTSDIYKSQAAALLVATKSTTTNACNSANDLINSEIRNAK